MSLLLDFRTVSKMETTGFPFAKKLSYDIIDFTLLAPDCSQTRGSALYKPHDYNSRGSIRFRGASPVFFVVIIYTTANKGR